MEIQELRNAARWVLIKEKEENVNPAADPIFRVAMNLLPAAETPKRIITMAQYWAEDRDSTAGDD